MAPLLMLSRQLCDRHAHDELAGIVDDCERPVALEIQIAVSHHIKDHAFELVALADLDADIIRD